MAKYDLDDEDFGAYAKTLTPSQVDEVIFENPPQAVEIVSDGAARIYYTINGETPVVGDSKCREMPNFTSVRVINIPRGTESLVVKLISSSAATYSVAKFQGKS